MNININMNGRMNIKCWELSGIIYFEIFNWMNTQDLSEAEQQQQKQQWNSIRSISTELIKSWPKCAWLVQFDPLLHHSTSNNEAFRWMQFIAYPNCWRKKASSNIFGAIFVSVNVESSTIKQILCFAMPEPFPVIELLVFSVENLMKAGYY